ncbi:uncharacterized protein LOC120710359 [Panicum virgatum]|uniref:Uncharacterized protein n=1 Tax=Panicum virgatum TaxID=38727 RepID=A0A8T0SWQ3_PANVG|nr:uncharacterized protein LOC120710359 [Panicum virgatum]KAG2602547.1 hypothetical protein PVAP13_5KG695900 [Panicum virgatum]
MWLSVVSDRSGTFFALISDTWADCTVCILESAPDILSPCLLSASVHRLSLSPFLLVQYQSSGSDESIKIAAYKEVLKNYNELKVSKRKLAKTITHEVPESGKAMSSQLQ